MYVHIHTHGAAIQNLQHGLGPCFVSSEIHFVEYNVVKTSTGGKKCCILFTSRDEGSEHV